MTTVIGIFDNDSDLEVALNRLYDRGFNEVRVVDRTRGDEVEPKIPAGALAPGMTSNTSGSTAGGVAPAVLLVPGFVDLDDESLNGSYVTENLDVPLTDEEADFYANVLRDGGKLLIVDTDDNHADMVWSVMRNSNASQYTRPEQP